MSFGYSILLVGKNKAADQKLLGVKLGRVCMKKNITVSETARNFNVSRTTVYNWFCGAYSPHHSLEEKIQNFLNTID